MRTTIIGAVVAVGLAVATPAAAQLFDAEQQRHVIDCAVWLWTDPATHAANCLARPAAAETTAAHGGDASAGGPASGGGGRGTKENTGLNPTGGNTGFGQPVGQNTGLYNGPSQNTGLYNSPDQNPGLFNPPSQNTGTPNLPNQNTGL